MNDIYFKSWSRVGAYLVGLYLGYILFKTKDMKSMVLSQLTWKGKLAIALGWAVSLVTMFEVVYGKEQQLSELDNIIFNSIHRQVWGIALAWLIFACVKVSSIDMCEKKF